MKWLTALSLAMVFLSLAPCHEALFKEKKCPVRNLKGGRVRTRSKGRILKYVCNRGFQVLGPKYSTCIRGHWDSPAPVCISGGCLPIDVAHGQVFETYRGAFVMVHCDPDHILVGTQSLYCNGAVWNDTAPTCRESTISAQKECDFESEDLCGWTHDANHEFDWKRHNFATPSGYMGTGPSFDHTHGSGLSGHYMYLETSSPRLENDTARLVSPLYSLPSNQNSCFKFWYHMYGNSTGSLNVYVKHQNMDLLFSKSGNQGDQWSESILQLPLLDSNLQIVIEGVRGSGYEGDIAIDDVKLTEGDECLETTMEASTVMFENTKTPDEASCENRCFKATSDRSICECNTDCIRDHTCCQDYLHMCSQPSLGFLSTTSSDGNEVSTSQSQLYHSKLPVNYIETQEPETSNLTEFHFTTLKHLNATTLPLHATSSIVVLLNTTTTTMSYPTTLPIKPTEKEKLFVSLKSVTITQNVTEKTSTSHYMGLKTESPIISSSEKPLTTHLFLNSTDFKNLTVENKTATTLPTFLGTTEGFRTSVFQAVNHTLNENKTMSTTANNVGTYQKSSTSIKPTKVTLLPTKQSSLQGRPTIIFKTPPPPIVLRPAKTKPITERSTKGVTLARQSSTVFLFSTHNSKRVVVNPSKQSKNDVLHPVWIQHDLETPQIDAAHRFKGTFTTQPSKSIKVTSVTRKDAMVYKMPLAKPEKVWIPQHKINETLPDKAQHTIPSPTHQPEPIILASVVLVGLSVLFLGVTLIRRLRINRSHSEDDELDIRFLSADEMLDFTLARPSPDECQRV